MNNVPDVKLGIVAVSRDCFPIELSQKRRDAVLEECGKRGLPVEKVNTIVENEKDAMKALAEAKKLGVNALVLYLGNFGPEGPTTMLAQQFDGPVMFVAAAEETQDNLIAGRGDAYCGMLNASYSAGLRKLRPYIPEYPVGIPYEVGEKIADFVPIARVIIGLKNLKIFAFGPRPQDFLACNAPIKALFDLGVEVMENSELDLYDNFKKAARRTKRVNEVVADMTKELGEGNTYPDLLKTQAQYEVALMKFFEDNLGASEFGIFANKCWPSFESYFGCTPCYINSRLAARGIPVSCEVDIYGALSEYIATCATEMPATLLDINNTVPYDMYDTCRDAVKDYMPHDLFMGFHCGNTSTCLMEYYKMNYQIIMHRLMEPGKDPNITRGTIEGKIKTGEITLFRLQSRADTRLASYVAEGEVLPVDPRSFGSIGVFGVKEMARFYRHVLIAERFPHHASIAFKHTGKTLFAAMKMLGVEDVFFNLPKGVYYKDENPFG